MDSSTTLKTPFSFEWTVKSTSCRIRYKKAFDINEIDEIFCTIVNVKGNQITVSDFGSLLGFNLNDLAELDILNTYLKGLREYHLIEINQKTIKLTEYGLEALQSKLKYKYFFATTEIFENQTATGESFDFSFKEVFDLENVLFHEKKSDNPTLGDTDLKQKLQFQLFENNVYKGEIVDLIESKPYIRYKIIVLQCDISIFENSFQFSIHKSGINKTEIETIICLTENEELKNKLIRNGMYHYNLANKSSITSQDIRAYIELWNWKELAQNPKVYWGDNEIFKLFREYGDASIWSIISDKTPLENIKSFIYEYADYWNWTTLSQRFDNNFIKDQIKNFNWDYEELSYKEPEFVIELLSISGLKDNEWDWNYLSKNLPDEFIENQIEDFAWDFFEITENKKEVFKNTFIKYRDKLNILISKNWNWKFISEEINLKFLYKNISEVASKVDWHTVLYRFFNREEIIINSLKNESFKSLLKKHLPDNFVIAHQKYIWTTNLIEFFKQQNLIQWESKTYIKGFDTNENVEWTKDIFHKYHNQIVTEKGYKNVSQHITDYSLIQEYPQFNWDWEGLSTNINLISKTDFIENAFSGKLSFSNNLLWNEIILHSNFQIDFWNKHLEAFYSATDLEKQIQFWHELTQKEKLDYIFSNPHFPWDWNFITKNSSAQIILDSFDEEELYKKWNWEIATRKLNKETILENLEDLTDFIDWKYLIKDLFEIQNELSIKNQLPRIVACLSVLEIEKRSGIWKELTSIYPFEILFNYVEATSKLDAFEWDWDYISNHKYFPTDIGTLIQYRGKISWKVLSESEAIQIKFNHDNWERGWFDNTSNYLRTFDDYWDWKKLSKNKNLNSDRRIVANYKNENWDWEYLSEFGGFLKKTYNDEANYLTSLLKQFQFYLKFDLLSKRSDIVIESYLILNNPDKPWNWENLSENINARITIEVLLKLRAKTWNWEYLSKRKDIVINNEALIELSNKKWDWAYLSQNGHLNFNSEFIEKTKEKPWNWKAISCHKSFFPTIEILTLTQEFELDWKYLSKHSKLNPTRELLGKFENKWDWQSITQNPQMNFIDFDFIDRFADKWDWRFICELGKLALNNQVLTQFKEYLKWDLISANTNIDFTKEIIHQFKLYWNWTVLKANKRVEELLGKYVAEEISKSATLTFIDKIEQQWSEWRGYVYHFSHIDNAVEIIKSRKIQSRNMANIRGDAAGNVVHLRNEAHDYARFYFRPHTPTQFYNEFLGKNISDGYESSKSGWVSWYEKARGLGFPKCPVPIFFRFSLKEVLFKNEKKCSISNGNMQTGSTKFGNIETMVNKFGYDDLFYTPQQGSNKEDYSRYRSYAQQEFLVKDELSFNDLTDFEIICSSKTDKALLINLLGQEHNEIFSKILVDGSYYNNENPRIKIDEKDSELHISTAFKGNGYFVLNGTSKIKEIEILSGDVSKMYNDKIIFSSYLSIGNLNQSISLDFIDESGRNWFVYAK